MFPKSCTVNFYGRKLLLFVKKKNLKKSKKKKITFPRKKHFWVIFSMYQYPSSLVLYVFVAWVGWERIRNDIVELIFSIFIGEIIFENSFSRSHFLVYFTLPSQTSLVKFHQVSCRCCCIEEIIFGNSLSRHHFLRTFYLLQTLLVGFYWICYCCMGEIIFLIYQES